MYIYKVSSDYDFMYWSTPSEEMSLIESISNKRAKDWVFGSMGSEKVPLSQISSVIEAQFFATLSLQVTQAIHSLITDHGMDYEKLSGIYIQRVNEVESGTDLSFVIGVVCQNDKYVISAYDISERFHHSLEASLIGSREEIVKPSTVH